MRDYPPARVIHEATCPDAPPGLQRIRAMDTRRTDPFAKAHRCVSPATLAYNRDVVGEPGDDTDHQYRPGPDRPEDATRPLCRACGGTHGELTGTLPLVLP